MVSFLVVGERVGSYVWLVDSDKEEAQEFMSLNRVFCEGIWGTGGIFCRAAKGSYVVSKDWPIESTLERAGEGPTGIELEGGSWMTREGPCFFDFRPIAEAIEFKETADFWREPGFERDHQFLEEESDINNKGMWRLLGKEGMHDVKKTQCHGNELRLKIFSSK